MELLFYASAKYKCQLKGHCNFDYGQNKNKYLKVDDLRYCFSKKIVLRNFARLKMQKIIVLSLLTKRQEE